MRASDEAKSEIERRFLDYRDRERDIRNQTARLEMLLTRISGPASPVLSDLPREPGYDVDKIPRAVIKKCEIETDIKEKIEMQKKEKSALERLIGKLHNPDERFILQVFYIDCAENWNAVVKKLYEDREDFFEKEVSYTRRVFRYRDKALFTLAERCKKDSP